LQGLLAHDALHCSKRYLKNVPKTPNLGTMAQGNGNTPGSYLGHQMLIAMPGMVDENFAGSVTLLCQHNDAGAIGITINRLSTYTLGEILQQLKIDCADESICKRPVLEGGPVAPDRGFVLHSPLPDYESSLSVGTDIMVTTSRDVLADIAQGKGPKKYLVALGYAGWGGGQLEGEMLANAWLSVDAATEIVFDLPLPNRFDEALGRLGIQVDRLHAEAGHA
jgi:putative transcriptional regulator